MSRITMIVSAPEGNGYSDPLALQRIIDHFDQLECNARFATRNGEIFQDSDGTYLVYADNEVDADFATMILRGHYGLNVTVDRFLLGR